MELQAKSGDDGEGAAMDPLAQRTRELEEAERRFRTLFDGIPETVLVHDAGGCVLEANQEGMRQLERSAGDLRGRKLSEIFDSENADRVLSAAALAATRGSATFEAACTTPSGRRLTLSVNSRAMEFNGRPAVVSVARDITDLRTADRQRADFMAMVAHDIRNPLSAVMGFADMLREMGGVDAERDDMLARLVSNSRAVVGLVSNYLDLCRIEARRLTLNAGRVELNVVLQQVGELYEDEARRKEISLDLDLERFLPSVSGDAVALERVFGNLVHNALKYTPARGRVTLQSRQLDSSLLACVVDTGPGIPADEVATIFDRYRRSFSGRAKHGSGLGLFIAKALVEAQGGEITVDTVPGAGCAFNVRLPFGAAGCRGT